MMKTISMLVAALAATAITLSSCRSHKAVTAAPEIADTATVTGQQFLMKVSDNAQINKFVKSKVKFSVKVGAQDITLTGNLMMKRDDVIRLQLMAFGFVEAGRLEFTKEYVLIMDRINKQYLKVNYAQLDFMRNSGINFYSLQALFWNELFQPGREHLTDTQLAAFDTDLSGDDAIISYEQDRLSYKWLAGKKDGLIKMANILFKDKFRGNAQLNWDYTGFTRVGTKQVPSDHAITFSLPEKEVKLGVHLSYITDNSDWPTRTEVSAKYKQVNVDDILRRFMAL